MFGLLIPIIIVVAIVVATRRHAGTTAAGAPPVVVGALLDRWQQAGLVSAEQRAAIEAVAHRLVLNKGPLKDGFDRPDGVLLFVGPTGVGKTALAKAVAEFMFGDARKMIRIDMSEYQDGGLSVDKLIGMPQIGRAHV